MLCTVCEVELTGRQRKFCSRKCQFKSQNVRHQNYEAQQARGKRRKLDAIQRKGGACSECGYNKNWAALAFHHTNDDKEFGLDLRVFSNNSVETTNKELEKCILLCHNCHAEHHHPMGLSWAE